MNVDQRQGQLNALGTAKLHTLLVKNVVLLIVMKPAVLMELTLAQTVAAENANVAHQPPPPALHQVVAHHQVAHHQVAHHQVVLLQKQEYGLIPTQVIQHLPVLIIIDTKVVKITAEAFLLIAAVPLYMTHSF